MAETDTVRIDYIEFASPRLEQTEAFFTAAFGWTYEEYGPDYRDISGAGTGGGIERGDLVPPLIVLLSDDLTGMRDKVTAAGGEITRDIYEFPGGKRFEFLEPGGTKLAVWSKG